MALLTPPFAESGERRTPSATERDLGFPCGPADRALFNDLQHKLEAEIGEVITYAGIAQTDARLTQLREAIQALIKAAVGPPLNLDGNGPMIVLNKQNGFESGILWQTNHANRWKLVSSAVTEGLGDTGSQWTLSGYLDINNTEMPILSVQRDTGAVTFAQDVAISGGTTEPTLYMTTNSATGGNYLNFMRGGNKAVWRIEAPTPNAAGNFALSVYDDAGNPLYTPLTIDRGNPVNISLSACKMLPHGLIGGLQYSHGFQFTPPTATNTIFIQGVLNPSVDQFLRIIVAGQNFDCSATGALLVPVKGYQPGGGSWGATSDARIKNVLGDYTSGLEQIKALQPVRYTYKGNDTSADPSSIEPGQESEWIARRERTGEEPPPAQIPYRNSPHYTVAADNKEFIGLIAQDCETVIPEMVALRRGFVDGEIVEDMRDLDTGPLIYALINAVKELSTRLEALEGGAARQGKRDVR